MNKIQKASITLMIIATGLAVLIILIPIFFDALTIAGVSCPEFAPYILPVILLIMIICIGISTILLICSFSYKKEVK